jgi:hypothetical protein
MAACFIFKRPLKVIFRTSGEHARTQGKQPFSDFHGHFHDNAGEPDPLNVANVRTLLRCDAWLGGR